MKPIYFNYLENLTLLEETMLSIKCVLHVSVQLLLEAFSALYTFSKTQDASRKACSSQCKCAIFPSDFIDVLKFPSFRTSSQYVNYEGESVNMSQMNVNSSNGFNRFCMCLTR
jgi:hypothetical protein